jgi:hypothetical protein
LVNNGERGGEARGGEEEREKRSGWEKGTLADFKVVADN